MRAFKLFCLGFILILNQLPAQAASKYNLEPGDVVLTNCRDIYTKGRNGAIEVKLLSSSPEAAATFWQWVGGNYVDLRHKSLDSERSKRSR